MDGPPAGLVSAAFVGRCAVQAAVDRAVGDSGRRRVADLARRGRGDRGAVEFAGSVAGGRAGRESLSGPGHTGERSGCRFHAVRPVRAVGLVAFVPREGRDPGVQRFGVHHGVPADDDRDAGRQGDAGQGRLSGAAARCRCQSGCDLARGRVVLFGASWDASLVAVPDRLVASVEAGLEGLRDRGGDRGRGDYPHARRCS